MINLPSYDIQAEQAVLGSILLDSQSERCQKALSKLSSDMFYTHAHSIIFDEIKRLISQHKPVDIVTLDSRLTEIGVIKDVGGFAYLAELSKTPVAVNVYAYCDIIRNKSRERKALQMLGQCQEILTSTGSLETTDKMEEIQKLFTAFDESSPKSGTGLLNINNIYEKWINEVEARYSDPESARGLTLGVKAIDTMLEPKGIVKGSLVVIGARPKMGKTAFLIKIAMNCAIAENKTTAIFSLEMPADQLFERMITQESGVSGDVFYDAAKNESGFNLAMSAIQGIIDSGKLYIDDTPAITLNHIKSECRRLKRKNGELGMIFVDYLTLMSADKAERNDLAYGIITKGLKALAKELNCVVVLLTQLNRNLENRTDKRPQPSDSRDTGQIEQDCDYWFGLFRESVYNEIADPFLTEIILRLNRHGSTGSRFVNMKYGQIFEVDQDSAREKSESLKASKKSKRYSKGEDDF